MKRIDTIRKTCLTAFLFLFAIESVACVTCNKTLQAAIADDSYRPGLVTMLSAFIVLSIVIVVLWRLTYKEYSEEVFFATGVPDYTAITSAAVITGIGLGGFLDGIIFHQILQWHGMLSNKIPPITVINKSVNMFWDGIFHLFVFCATLVGMLRIWRLSQKMTTDHSGKRLLGGMLLGWGLLNVVEGVINHHVLELHNVREGMHASVWNYGFLIFSALIISCGIILTRRRKSVVKIATPEP